VLDFCNTRAGWNAAEPREYLTSYEHLFVWAREAGLVDPAVAERLRRADGAAKTLTRALRLRDAIYDVCTNGADKAWDIVAVRRIERQRPPVSPAEAGSSPRTRASTYRCSSLHAPPEPSSPPPTSAASGPAPGMTAGGSSSIPAAGGAGA
jgi:hypothetical protein